MAAESAIREGLHYGLLMLMALIAVPAFALAQEPDSSQPVVLMLPELADDRDELAEATITAHLQDSGVELLVRRYEPGSLEIRGLYGRSEELLEVADARGIMWVDLETDIALYVLVRGSSELLGRSLAGRDVSEAVALESLANVAATTAVALSEGRPIVLELPESEEPVTGPEPEPEPEPAPVPSIEVEGQVIPKLEPHARLRIGYRGQSFASGLPWLSAAELAFGWRPTAQSHVELGYEAATPVVVEARSVGLQLQLFRAPVALLGGYRFDLRRGWGVELAGRLGVEPTRRQTVAASDPLLATGPEWTVAAALGVDVRSTVAIRDDLRLWMSVGLLGAFVRSEYLLAGIDEPLLSPSPVRFAAGIGAEFDFIHR